MSKIITEYIAVKAILNRTNCDSEEELREFVSRHSLQDYWSGGILDAIDAVKGINIGEPKEENV